MIDDEFETVFRKLFESLMNSMGQMTDGESTIRYWTSSNLGSPGITDVPQTEYEMQAEVIDLEDRVLILVEMESDDEIIDVKVEGRTLKVFNQVDGKETIFDLDFDVDIEDSRTSCRNGILEIELKKADDKDGQHEGYLKID